jgi:hypothetical protein
MEDLTRLTGPPEPVIEIDLTRFHASKIVFNIILLSPFQSSKPTAFQ